MGIFALSLIWDLGLNRARDRTASDTAQLWCRDKLYSKMTICASSSWNCAKTAECVAIWSSPLFSESDSLQYEDGKYKLAFMSMLPEIEE